jgi:hypothetical protein
MPKLDPGRLIQEAQELIAASKDLCARSRHAIEKSEQLEEIFTGCHIEQQPSFPPRPKLTSRRVINLL